MEHLTRAVSSLAVTDKHFVCPLCHHVQEEPMRTPAPDQCDCKVCKREFCPRCTCERCGDVSLDTKGDLCPSCRVALRIR